VFPEVCSRWDVRPDGPGAHLQPLPACLDQLAQRLVAGIALAVFVGRYDRLGRAGPSRQLGLRQPLPAPKCPDERRGFQVLIISECL